MQMSYSRVDSFEKCPYKWKLHYIDHLETIPDKSPTNALTLGTVMHKGAEEGLDAALQLYKDSVWVYDDACIHEEIKFNHWIPKLAELPEGMHEVTIHDEGKFIGFIDLVVPNEDGTFDLYDYKYTSEAGVQRYKESGQLQIYKYYFEKLGMGKVRDLYFVFIPKIQIRQKKTEDLYQFRQRLYDMLESRELEIWKSEKNFEILEDFFKTCGLIEATKEFPKNETYLCGWCEYEGYCKKGLDFMLLPKNERRKPCVVEEPDMWIYGASYSGKTTFVDQFDDVLFLNTDGNIDAVTSPVIRIKDTMEGRMKVLAWNNFLEVVKELEIQKSKGEDNDFKIIAIDLLEDLFEQCRLYVFDREKIRHESDSGYGKGWDLVTTEFNSTIKRLKNIGYRVFYISKEKSESVNLRGGASLTSYRPNIRNSVAEVMAGTVGLTVRIFADDKGRWINLRPDEYVFGGGRFNFKQDEIPLTVSDFKKALIEAQEGLSKPEPKSEPVPVQEPVTMGVTESPEMMGEETVAEEPVEEAPVRQRRTRKKREE